MRYRFRWNAANLANVAKHGLAVDDVEWVIDHARKPFPLALQGNFRTCGTTESGRWVETLYRFDPMPTEADFAAGDEREPDDDEIARLLAMADAIALREPSVYVFHAMPIDAARAAKVQSLIREATS